VEVEVDLELLGELLAEAGPREREPVLSTTSFTPSKFVCSGSFSSSSCSSPSFSSHSWNLRSHEERGVR
jgi:hypothetical protein